ncbi:MAG: gliding motility-associated C-terminal domain-containing protein [Lentimicrobiaceae bacterium]|nr:gliding motility-associated C-terminal domain-containing protein [Lentimicrobiaceae bacterium]
MKTYNNVEVLYREKFSAYTPEPPAEVWERIELSMNNGQMSVKGKVAVIATAVVVVAVVAYWGINRFSATEKPVEEQKKEQFIAANLPSETVDIAEEEVIVSSKETPPKALSTNAVSCGNGFAATDLEDEITVAEPNNKPDAKADAVFPIQQKTEKETVVEKAKTDEKTAEVPEKTPPVVVEETETVEIPTAELFVPEAFTPNGDGLNDVFSAQSEEEYTYFEMSIYSRNGQLLFASKNIKHGWDGTYKGVPQPHGSYVYVIRYRDAAGQMHDKKGNFLLILAW